MVMIVNGQNFDAALKQIGDLYEEGKDCLHGLSILHSELKDYHRLFDIIREMRDIAAVNLKAGHEVKEN